MGSLGFSGPSSLLYHLRSPTRVTGTSLVGQVVLAPESDQTLRMRHFHLRELPSTGSLALDRVTVLYNQDIRIAFARTRTTDEFFYRNGQADELAYICDGSGVLESEFGELVFRPGDYVVVPRGIVHRWRIDDAQVSALVIETTSRIRCPSRYLTAEGQLMEHAPYCERDIRAPAQLVTRDEPGEFRIVVKQQDVYSEIRIDHHPLDVVGWDGCYYPFALSIHDFEPITGSLHQPPPVHQTFQADQFVVCSFVPRKFDYHPEAVPAPYNHGNVMSDEVLFYANDEFMSRSGISYGSLTLHPAGLPHGPHPGRAEQSIGKPDTKELAVMVDTFRCLRVTQSVLAVEDSSYGASWLPRTED